MQIEYSGPYRSAKSRILRQFGRMIRTPLLSWTARGYYRSNINIVYYHGVWPRGHRLLDLFGGMDFDTFAAELKLLQRSFEFVSLDEALAERDRQRSGRPTLTVTFDDGFDLLQSGAADVLRSLRVPATMFVNTASVGYARLMWTHKLSAIRAMRGADAVTRAVRTLPASLASTRGAAASMTMFETMRSWASGEKDSNTAAVWDACDMPDASEILTGSRPYLDWDGLRRWIGEGHSVGFHTASHPFCSELSAPEVAPELIAPVAELREKLNLTTVPFAYPFGKRLPAALEAEVTKMAVFSCMLGTGRFSPRSDRPEQLDRVGGEEGADFAVFGRPLSQAVSRGFMGKGR